MAPTNFLASLVALLGFASWAHGQEPSMAPSASPPTLPAWSGCYDANLGPLVIIGQPTTICLVLSNNLNWNGQPVDYLRLSFQPNADEFSRFIVPACKSVSVSWWEPNQLPIPVLVESQMQEWQIHSNLLHIASQHIDIWSIKLDPYKSWGTLLARTLRFMLHHNRCKFCFWFCSTQESRLNDTSQSNGRTHNKWCFSPLIML